MHSSLTRQRWTILLLIIGGAFAVRLWGVGYGLPFSYHNDEYHEVMRAIQLGTGSFNFDRIGKGGLYYLLFVEYGVYFAALKLMGAVNSPADFALHFVQDPSAFYYMGRVTVVVFGTLTVILAFLLGRRAYGSCAGLLAAMFLATNVMHAELSQKIIVDIPMLFFVGATLYVAVKLIKEDSLKNYLWAAIFASLATTTKIPAIVLIVPLLVAHTYSVRGSGGGIRQWFSSRQLWIAAGIFVAVLLITNPGIVFAYKYINLFTGSGTGPALELLEEVDGDPSNSVGQSLFLYYLNAMRSSMGWPLAIASALGSLFALWKRTPADVILLSFGLIFYLAIASTSSDLVFPRYVLPVVFVVLLFAGRVVHEMTQYRANPNLHLVVLLALLLIAIPAWTSIQNSYLYTQTDTRTLAKEWIEENIPQGAKVLIEGAKVAPVRNTVQLQNTAKNLRELVEYWEREEPRQAEYLRVKQQVLEGKTFDLVLVRLKEVENIRAYSEMGVEYFVITPRFWESRRQSSLNSLQLVHDLRSDARIRLIHRIAANPQSRPGPTVEIYGFER